MAGGSLPTCRAAQTPAAKTSHAAREEFGSVRCIGRAVCPQLHLPAVETKWLEDFVSLAETRSFSRSAQLRHVTQPAFSRRIQALEAWAGIDLVDRSSYPTRLTPAGETFHAQALEIARIPEQIKGYGHVKERHLQAARARWAELMTAYRATVPPADAKRLLA